MSGMVKEFDYLLNNEIEYANNGNQVGGTFIKLSAPSRKQLPQCTMLKQAFFKTMSSMSDSVVDGSSSRKKKDSDELEGKDIIAALYMGDVDMVKVLAQAEILFTSGVALIDGEVKLTIPLIEEMVQDDLEVMTGEYLANFILFSVLKDLK